MELTREVLEFCTASDGCEIRPTCEGCVCFSPDGDCDAPECEGLATLALSLMDERDRLRMQVKEAERVIDKAASILTAETDEGLAALCALQAWTITPTEMYHRNEVEMEAAHAEAGQ
jgi:hypothetical protein